MALDTAEFVVGFAGGDGAGGECGEGGKGEGWVAGVAGGGGLGGFAAEDYGGGAEAGGEGISLLALQAIPIVSIIPPTSLNPLPTPPIPPQIKPLRTIPTRLPVLPQTPSNLDLLARSILQKQPNLTFLTAPIRAESLTTLTRFALVIITEAIGKVVV